MMLFDKSTIVGYNEQMTDVLGHNLASIQVSIYVIVSGF